MRILHSFSNSSTKKKKNLREMSRGDPKGREGGSFRHRGNKGWVQTKRIG